MRINDPFINPVGIHCLNFFGGGSSVPSQPKPVKIPDPPVSAQNMPKPPAPLPPPPPLPTKSNLDSSNAAAQAKLEQSKRRGYAKSLLAGETGGYGSNQNGGSSLLG